MNTSHVPKEPLAIVGIGCRFPGGASNPQRFWQLLMDKKDVMCNIPKARWDYRQFCDADPDKIGKAYNFQGGFLQEDIELFDPLFFGISPREARVMDPQQRLLLEVAWEAMEDAGLTQEALAGSQTGVFIGGFWLDHQINQFCPLNLDIANSHSPMSATLTLLSNRISYVFDLKGPSLTIDTACSSSLVAAHYACQSIWNNESEMAMVGGVNVMTSPSNSIGLSKGKFLSDHSRCMTFDERASGYARGEGAGVVLIMPWSAAQSGGFPVYALIRATGVNQDGQTQGITLPNPEAQKELMRKVYAQAGVMPGQIQYIEAHGTGTQAGDMAETQALHEVLSDQGRRQDKVLVGSVKTNMGHLEAAAGMAGMIKAALSLKHKKIPANLHFEKPNPKIPFAQMCLEVPIESREWPKAQRALAGVNAFGYGGTNAHMLLEGAPEHAATGSAAEGRGQLALVPLSAQNEKGLQAQAEQLASFLQTTPIHFEDVLKTLCLYRSHLRVRSFALAKDREGAIQELKKISQGAGVPLLPMTENPKLAFVFTGMGPQWWGMGRELFHSLPLFRKTVENCDRIFQSLSGWSIQAAMLAPEAESVMSQTRVAQVANFVLQAALTDVLTSWGIKPDAVIGHSVGEVAAAYVSGALSLEEALQVSYHRSRLQQTLAGQGGGMLAINLSEADALSLFRELKLNLSIAAVNSWNSVTVSGGLLELDILSAYLSERGQFNRTLKVEIAYHSQQMDVLESELRTSLQGLHPRTAVVPLYSTVTGARIDGKEMDAGYWWKNVRQPVHFQAGMAALLDDGFGHMLEVGPHPVLAQSIQAEGTRRKKETRLAATLNRTRPEWETFLNALGTLYQWGRPLHWPTQVDPRAVFVPLPGYPWQRERYWFETELLREYRMGREGHVLLNRAQPTPDPAWEVELNFHYFPYLQDHRIGDTVVVPGALYVEAGLAVGQELFQTRPIMLENIRFHQVCTLLPGKVQRLHVRCLSSQQVEIYSITKDEGAAWLHHASASLKSAAELTRPPVDLASLRARCPEAANVDEFYRVLEKRNLNYGPYFKPITRIWRGKQDVLIQLNPGVLPEAQDHYLLGPTILDALFQSLVAVVRGNPAGDGRQTFIPVAIERITWFAPPTLPCFGLTTLVSQNEKTLRGDSLLVAADGTVLAELSGILCQQVTQDTVSAQAQPEWFYEWAWLPEKRPEVKLRSGNPDWLIIHQGVECIPDLVKTLRSGGITPWTVEAADGTVGKLPIPPDKLSQVVFLLGGEDAKDPGALYRMMLARCCGLTDFLKQDLGPARSDDKRLTLVTWGLHPNADDQAPMRLNGAPLWGLLRVVRNEYPQINCTLIDLDPRLEANEWVAALVSELETDSKNEEIALGPSLRRVHRLQRAGELSQQPAELRLVSVDQPLALAGEQGDWHFQASTRLPLADDEVEIKVESALLTRWPASWAKLLHDSRLGEFSGTVVAAGAAVQGLSMGDSVAVFHFRPFSNYLRIPAKHVIKQTAGHRTPVSLAWVAAHVCATQHARFRTGECLVLQGGMNEMGLAMVRFAQAEGATVIAACQTQAEKQWFEGLGLAKRLLTDGPWPQSADVVCSLDSQTDARVMDALKPFGRLVQLRGEQDLDMNTLQRAAKKCIALSIFNLKWLLDEEPEVLRDLALGFLACPGPLCPPPGRVISLAQLPEILKQDEEATTRLHVEVKDQVPVLQAQQRIMVKPDVSYLISGGTGGFGLEVARWLASQGASELILISRSGGQRKETQAVVEEIRNQGCLVSVKAVDVTDAAAVAALLAEIRKNHRPLKGIFHSAMVLADAYIQDLKPEQWETVMAPKILGALHLDAYTRDMNLDLFVMFSSISSVIGNPGQANYSAANAFLDAFARYRRGITINWGVLSESGVVSRNRQVAKLLEHAGLRGFNNVQALHAMERAVAMNTPQVGIFDVDWPTWLNANPAAGTWPALGKLAAAQSVISEKIENLLDILQPLGQAEREEAIEQRVMAVISQVVKIPEKTIQRQQNIMNYGVDSLMALDLARSLKTDLGLELGMMELMNGPSVRQLGKMVLNQLEAHFSQRLMEQIDTLSEAQLDELLAKEQDTAPVN